MFDNGTMTIKNYGLRSNCSVSLLYPERVEIISMDVGQTKERPALNVETGLIEEVRDASKDAQDAKDILTNCSPSLSFNDGQEFHETQRNTPKDTLINETYILYFEDLMTRLNKMYARRTRSFFQSKNAIQ